MYIKDDNNVKNTNNNSFSLVIPCVRLLKIYLHSCKHIKEVGLFDILQLKYYCEIHIDRFLVGRKLCSYRKINEMWIEK